MDTFLGQLGINILASFIFSFLGVVFAFLLGKFYFDRCYAGWRVRLIQDGTEKLDRPITPRKAREICDEPADLSVFLKGVASPYGFITCDIIQDGVTLGLLGVQEERKYIQIRNRDVLRRYIRRIYTIDMDKNPTSSSAPASRPAT